MVFTWYFSPPEKKSSSVKILLSPARSSPRSMFRLRTGASIRARPKEPNSVRVDEFQDATDLNQKEKSEVGLEDDDGNCVPGLQVS